MHCLFNCISLFNFLTQVVAESSQAPNQTQYKPSQNEQNHVRTDAHYDYELPADGHVHSDYLNAHLNSQQRSSPLIAASSEELQVMRENICIHATFPESILLFDNT